MNNIMKTITFCIALFAAVNTCGQDYYVIDLAEDKHDEQTISLRYKGIKLIHKMPDQRYSVRIDVTLEVSEPGIKKGNGADTLNCNRDSLIQNIMKATNEREVRSAIKKLESDANQENGSIGNGCYEQAIDEAKKETTELRSFYFDLEQNQTIYITITRPGRDDPWKITLRTPRATNYLSHFGFTFVMNGNKNSDRYYSRETAEGVYTITQMNENGEPFWKDLSLTANYIIPLSKKQRRIGWGINGGFGLNGNASFTVMAGGTLLFYDFLSLNICAGLYNRYKLKGEYIPGQQLTENLSVDQLNDYGLRPGLMFSLGFRLSKEQLQTPAEEKGTK